MGNCLFLHHGSILPVSLFSSGPVAGCGFFMAQSNLIVKFCCNKQNLQIHWHGRMQQDPDPGRKVLSLTSKHLTAQGSREIAG